MTFWTQDRIMALRSLAAEGLSASEIGGRLGVTRNAILGRLYRMGMPLARKPGGEKARQPRTSRPRRTFQDRMVVLATKHTGVADLSPDTSPDACGLMALRHDSCRWPLGEPSHDMQYCGAQQHPAGGSYCARHARLAYRPLQSMGARN